MILTESLKSIRQSKDKHSLAMQSIKAALPVNKLKQEILNLVNDHTYSIIVAETGSGKSTQVPQIILDDAIDRGEGGLCNIFCVQPRRVAAQMLARRVAEERHDKSGTIVGHMVRFDNQMPAKSGAITYCTTGIMLNMLQNPNASLSLYSHIMLDEVHVRDIGIDLVMLLLKRRIDQLRKTGARVPKIVVMSATLDVDLFSSYFLNEESKGNVLPAPHISIPGRQYHVQKHYLEELLTDLKTSSDSKSFLALLEEPETASFLKDQYKHFPPPTAEDSQEAALDVLNTDIEDPSKHVSSESSPDPAVQNPDEFPHIPFGLICAAIFHILKSTESGAILVFLPGMAHLLNVEKLLYGYADSMNIKLQNEQLFRILKLHSELPEELEKLSVKVPGGCRRILLSTDIAEASLTLPDVEYVIDAGRVNQLFSSQRSLSSRMALSRISQSSSSQRAGRAGRVKNGQYFFLGTQRCFDSLRVTNAPEIVRSDLLETCLRAKHMGPESSISGILKEAIESPDEENVELAVESLKRLSALHQNEYVAPLGELLVQLPLHPISGKLVILGAIFRCLDPMVILGAIGVDRGLFQRPKLEDQQIALRKIRHAFANGSSSDQISSINAFKAMRKVWKEQGRSAASNFAYSNFIHLNNYGASLVEAEQILERLHRMGFQTKADGKDYQFGGAELNVNSENTLLIKTLLLHCLSPRIAFPKTYKNGNALAYQTHSESKKPTVYGVSPSCEGNRSGSVAVYGKKIHISPGQMIMSDLSLVSPLAASLFGGKTDQHLEESQNDVIVEDFMPITFDMKDMDVIPGLASQRVIRFRIAFSAVGFNTLKPDLSHH
jgi:HrpA-like RNA helicase